MKLGVLVNFNPGVDLEKKFADLRTYGFESCQLCSWTPSLWTDEAAANIVSYSEKYGIEISAFWCGWEGPTAWNFYEGQLTLGLIPPEYRVMRVKNLCDGADFAKKLGVKDIITHMGFIPENPYDPNFAPLCVAIRTVAEHLIGNEQNLLFETGQETPIAMLRCFETVGCPNLFINLDTANLILYGKANPVDSLDMFGKYVRNLHAKDGVYPTNGHELGAETKLGEGKVDFVKLFEKLHELGYDSYVTIEREIEGEGQIRDILESKEYLENVIAQVYGK